MSKPSGRTLYDKIWESHTVDILPTGQTQLFIGLHLIHEITTAPAFDMLREKGLKVAFPERTFATVDHVVPTDIRTRPFLDEQAEELTQALEKNVGQFDIEFFGLGSDRQGIVHVIGSRRAGNPDARDGQAQSEKDQRKREAVRRDLCKGRDPDDYPETWGKWRQRLRL